MSVSKHFSLFLALFLALSTSFSLRAQPQSGRVFEFLTLPSTARITALGGYAIPDNDNNDLGMALFYPSLMRKELTSHLSMNFVDYFGDINYGTVAFARYFNRLGPISGSLQYISYGRFIEADETGLITGEFTGGEYSFMVGWGRQLSEMFYIGSNLKSIHSYLHDYNSWGLAVDLSVAYQNPENLFSAALVARNIGVQLGRYRPGDREQLPFDLVFGASHTFANAPIRLTLVAHNIQKFDLTYPSQLPVSLFPIQESAPTFGEKASEFGDKLMRHAVFGLEFMPSRSFHVRMGYNYRRRQEMQVESRLSTVGFSWGFGIKISRFQLNYGRSAYHLAGAPNHVSISTSLNDLLGRPEQIPSE